VNKNDRFSRRVRYALGGWSTAFNSEHSFKTQLILGGIALLGLLALRPPLIWSGLCILAAAGVLCAELFNTALERLSDHLHPDVHPAIKAAKDCAAGAVLIASLAAVVVGLLTVVAVFAAVR
jgi:undecaprenol kinase